MVIRIAPTTRIVSSADVLRAKCKTALANHRRRARADGQTVDYTADDLLRIATDTVVCCYCKQPLGWGGEWDHSMPTARGGKHCLTNLRMICKGCNQAKGQLSGESYLKLLELINTFLPAETADLLRRLRAGGTRYSGRARK